MTDINSINETQIFSKIRENEKTMSYMPEIIQYIYCMLKNEYKDNSFKYDNLEVKLLGENQSPDKDIFKIIKDDFYIIIELRGQNYINCSFFNQNEHKVKDYELRYSPIMQKICFSIYEKIKDDVLKHKFIEEKGILNMLENSNELSNIINKIKNNGKFEFNDITVDVMSNKIKIKDKEDSFVVDIKELTYSSLKNGTYCNPNDDYCSLSVSHNKKLMNLIQTINDKMEG